MVHLVLDPTCLAGLGLRITRTGSLISLRRSERLHRQPEVLKDPVCSTLRLRRGQSEQTSGGSLPLPDRVVPVPDRGFPKEVHVVFDGDSLAMVKVKLVYSLFR